MQLSRSLTESLVSILFLVEDYSEVLKKVKFTPMTWMHDNKGFFYGVNYLKVSLMFNNFQNPQAYLEQEGKVDGSETVSNKYQKLYYHRLGTDQSNDVIAAEFDDPHYRM